MYVIYLPLASIYPSAFVHLSELTYSFIICKSVILKTLTRAPTQELKF